MHKRYAAKSTLFLMELVIVLFFFSICAAVCVSLFGYSQQMARESDALSNGVLAARSTASCYKAAGNLPEAMELLHGQWEDGQVIIYYDSQWNPVEEGTQNGFTVQLTEPEKPGEALIVVRAMQETEPIFQLRVKVNRGGAQHAAQ